MGRPAADEGLALAAAGAGAAVGLIGVLGRLSGTRSLYEPVPGGGGFILDSAIALTLLAVAVTVHRRWVSVPSLAGAAALGLLSFVQYAGAADVHPGSYERMPLATSVCVLLLGFAAATRRRPLLRQLAALTASAVGGLVLLGFGYGTRTLTKFSDSSMSVSAAVAVVLIALAVLARTEDGWLRWVWHGSDAGAVALRRTLPPVILGLPVLTFLHMHGERIFWRDERVAEAGFVLVLTVLVCALLFRVASSLRLLDLQREQARQDLQALNARLMTDVRSHYDSLLTAQQRIGSLENSQRAVLTVHDDVLQTLFASGLMLRTTLDSIPADAPVDASVERTLDCMDDAVRAIRQVVENLNDQLGGPSTPTT